jgi:hypothetical protein
MVSEARVNLNHEYVLIVCTIGTEYIVVAPHCVKAAGAPSRDLRERFVNDARCASGAYAASSAAQ